MRACPRCRSAYVSEIEFCGLDGVQLVETDTDPLIGELVDRYQVVELIGRGAMGCVYRARHTTLERDFAMKVLFGDLASNRMFAGRFRREAQALSKLRHTNIISVNDFGTTEHGLTYLVMDYVQGTTLAEVIRVDAPLYAFRAARIARQIASALAEAHRQGLIHRDVKPENIFLVSEGDEEVVKLLDFGIVAVDDDASETKLTGHGRIVGTPTYMAPEQARQGPVTHSVDLYALGVILHEMLSGRPPFEGSVAELLVRHALEAPPPLPSCGGLEDLVARLLAKEAEGRPPNANAVIMEIDGLVLDWSGVSNVTPLEAAVPLARSISAPGLRLGTSPNGRLPSTPKVVHAVRTLEVAPGGAAPAGSGPARPSSLPSHGGFSDPPQFIAPGPLAEDLEVPLPSSDLPRLADLAASARKEPAHVDAHPLAEPLGLAEPNPFEHPEHTPPYDPFLQPDPYYSNLVDDELDGLLPKSLTQGSSSGFSQDLSPNAWAEGSPSPVESLTPRALPGQVLGVEDTDEPVPSQRVTSRDLPPVSMPPPGQRFVTRDLTSPTPPAGGQRVFGLPPSGRLVTREAPTQPTPVDLVAPGHTSQVLSAARKGAARSERWQRLGPTLVFISLILSVLALAAALLLPRLAGEGDAHSKAPADHAAPGAPRSE